MGQAAVVFRTRTGIRRTQPTDTLSVDVEPVTNVQPVGSGGEGWIDRVEFSVVQNGGAPTVYTVSSQTLRTPNYSDFPAPHWKSEGGMVPTSMFGITLACSPAASGIVVAYGRIEVTAVVYSKAGTATAVPDRVVLYNDADGIDRRPNSDVLYVDGDAGNDSWDGTSPTFLGGSVGPKKTPAKALDGECGGKRIHVSGDVEWFGSLAGTVQCSDDWWCDVILDDTATLRRGASINTIFGTSTRFNLKLTGGTVIGQNLDVQRTGANTEQFQVWCDGMQRHSEYYTPERPCTVLYESSNEAQGGQSIVNFTGSSNDNYERLYASCCSIVGLHKGFANYTDVHDCEVAYIMAEALVSNNSTNGAGHSCCNLNYHDQLAGTHLVRGWFSSLVHSGNLTISTAGLPAGQAKIAQTAPIYIAVFGISDDPLAPVDIAWTGDELIGRDGVWDMQFSGMADSGNNGHFPVLSVGYDGATPYVIVQNASAVPGVQNAGKITTWYVNSGAPDNTVDPHGDIWHGDGPHTNGVLSGIVTRNVWHVQSIFVPSTCTLNRFGIINCAFSSPYETISDFNFNWTGTTTDVTVIGNTFDHGGTIGGTNTNLCIVDNMFRGSMTIVAGTTPFIDHNHFVSGTTYGTNITTGQWFDSQPIDKGWIFEPSAVNLNGASGLWDRPSERWWPSATAASIGVDALASTETVIPLLQSDGTSSDTAIPFLTLGASGTSLGASSYVARGIIVNIVDASATSLGKSGDIATPSGYVAAFGTENGSSTSIAIPKLSLRTAGSTAGSSSSASVPFLLLGTTGLSAGSSTSVGLPSALAGSGLSAGSSTASAVPSLLLFPSGTSAGISSTTLTIASIVAAYGESLGVSSTTLNLAQLLKSAPTSPKRVLMKQRIHNALVALARQGPYYRCAVNAKTGQMSIDLDKPVTPQGVKVAELQVSYAPARGYRRTFGPSEIEHWSWIARVEFPGMEVACEVFEESITDNGIQIPPVEGLPNQRRLLARLVRSDYSHPPEQSPNSGTVAEFSFEIVPELLRK